MTARHGGFARERKEYVEKDRGANDKTMCGTKYMERKRSLKLREIQVRCKRRYWMVSQSKSSSAIGVCIEERRYSAKGSKYRSSNTSWTIQMQVAKAS